MNAPKLQKRTREFARVARQLKKKGLTNRKIAEEMTALGMFKKNGSSITAFNVAHYLRGRMRKQRMRRHQAEPVAPVKERPSKAQDDQIELIELIVASKIGSDRKVRAIQQLLS